MWPFGKAKRQTQELKFKGSKAFFDYQCRFGDTSIEEKKAIVAIIVDAQKEFGTSKSISIEPDGTQTAAIRVAADDGGFVVLASTLSSKGESLNPGDLVFWVPMAWNEELARELGDERQGWIGLIVAKLRPELLAGNGWSIACKY
jgi:hypothetical protein